MTLPHRAPRYLLFSTCLVLVLLEVLPRILPLPGLSPEELDPPVGYATGLQRCEPHPYLAYAPRPGWSTAEEQTRFIASHNDLGFRGPEIVQPKPEGTFRVVCLGGSSTYGTGPSSNENTYPARLQHHLHKLGVTSAEVVNLGVPGWTTTESLINLCLRGVELDPDLVLVYHATNDAFAALWPEPAPDQSHFRVPWTFERRSSLEQLMEKSRIFLMARAFLTDHRTRGVDQAFYTIRNHDPDYSEPDMDRVIPARGFLTYERNLRHITAVARAEGAQVAMVVQAFHPGEGKGPHRSSGAVRRRAMRDMLEVQAQVASDLEVSLIDTASVLEEKAQGYLDQKGSQPIFTNNVHLRDAGTNLLGSELASQLIERGLVPKP